MHNFHSTEICFTLVEDCHVHQVGLPINEDLLFYSPTALKYVYIILQHYYISTNQTSNLTLVFVRVSIGFIARRGKPNYVHCANIPNPEVLKLKSLNEAYFTVDMRVFY